MRAGANRKLAPHDVICAHLPSPATGLTLPLRMVAPQCSGPLLCVVAQQPRSRRIPRHVATGLIRSKAVRSRTAIRPRRPPTGPRVSRGSRPCDAVNAAAIRDQVFALRNWREPASRNLPVCAIFCTCAISSQIRRSVMAEATAVGRHAGSLLTSILLDRGCERACRGVFGAACRAATVVRRPFRGRRPAGRLSGEAH